MTASIDFRAIGVDCRIVATDAATLADARELAGRRLAQLDMVASRFRPDSEVRRLAAQPGPVGRGIVTAPATPLLLSLLEDALWAAAVTDGLVDPTLGRAMAANGYDADLAEVLTRPSVENDHGTTPSTPGSSLPDVRINPAASTVSIAAGTLLDLGATAKATTADRIARELAAGAGTGFLVDLGGDLAVAGRPPSGGWVIETDDTASRDSRITITEHGVATSGTDRRRWEHHGVTKHHLLDPATGRPVRRTWRRVTCVAASALEANTATTAACVLGEAAVDWLCHRRIPARLVPEEGAIRVTPLWPTATPSAKRPR